jgi:predicted N-acetyltransferase YhbS
VKTRPAHAADRDAVSRILIEEGWQDGFVDVGQTWVTCKDGEVVGTARLIASSDDLVYVADVMVREDRRGSGIGSEMMREIMSSRGSAEFFLVCHPERVAFYERLGFVSEPKDSWPDPIVATSMAEDDYDGDHDHLHNYLRAPHLVRGSE